MQDVSTRAEQMGSSSSPVHDIFNVFNYLKRDERTWKNASIENKTEKWKQNRPYENTNERNEITCLSAEIINFLD